MRVPVHASGIRAYSRNDVPGAAGSYLPVTRLDVDGLGENLVNRISVFHGTVNPAGKHLILIPFHKLGPTALRQEPLKVTIHFPIPFMEVSLPKAGQAPPNLPNVTKAKGRVLERKGADRLVIGHHFQEVPQVVQRPFVRVGDSLCNHLFVPN